MFFSFNVNTVGLTLRLLSFADKSNHYTSKSVGTSICRPFRNFRAGNILPEKVKTFLNQYIIKNSNEKAYQTIRLQTDIHAGNESASLYISDVKVNLYT